MPLFGSKKDKTPVAAQPAPSHRSKRSSASPPHSPAKSGGLFGHRHSQSVSSMSSSDIDAPRRSGGMSNLLHRHNEDPSIAQARERVIAAEKAERDADLALQQARSSVRAAHEHVHKLEVEADAEAKAARLKQDHARDLGKRAKPLGRFG